MQSLYGFDINGRLETNTSTVITQGSRNSPPMPVQLLHRDQGIQYQPAMANKPQCPLHTPINTRAGDRRTANPPLPQ